MNEAGVLAYVNAAAALLALPLDEARARRVAGHLLRTADLAKLLQDAPLAPDDELAAIYCPLPFQPMNGGQEML